MTSTIASDNPLSEQHQALLKIVLDQIIPADPARRKPSAAILALEKLVEQFDENALNSLLSQLDRIEWQALEKTGKNYLSLDRHQQDEIVHQMRQEDPDFLRYLAFSTVSLYYQDPTVMESIGLPHRPPYPEGYSVPRGDTSLLEPVKARGTIWRRTTE